jgi:hypothetical protein
MDEARPARTTVRATTDEVEELVKNEKHMLRIDMAL